MCSEALCYETVDGSYAPMPGQLRRWQEQGEIMQVRVGRACRCVAVTRFPDPVLRACCHRVCVLARPSPPVDARLSFWPKLPRAAGCATFS